MGSTDRYWPHKLIYVWLFAEDAVWVQGHRWEGDGVDNLATCNQPPRQRWSHLEDCVQHLRVQQGRQSCFNQERARGQKDSDVMEHWQLGESFQRTLLYFELEQGLWELWRDWRPRDSWSSRRVWARCKVIPNIDAALQQEQAAELPISSLESPILIMEECFSATDLHQELHIPVCHEKGEIYLVQQVEEQDCFYSRSSGHQGARRTTRDNWGLAICRPCREAYHSVWIPRPVRQSKKSIWTPNQIAPRVLVALFEPGQAIHGQHHDRRIALDLVATLLGQSCEFFNCFAATMWVEQKSLHQRHLWAVQTRLEIDESLQSFGHHPRSQR